ncbi:menaquinone biosynthetic enzyme MqnA/MqnD family protein [Polluticaenibacter yanchengensis]|uniref:Chorismate dehydratase n=1 Tax=Polluticaenibacter yanchengensis TaxID=3014562 RepID=A0ABT4UPN0_9BACT|nr:menaquinone biosynthesis protein [Chitinophagaceae bacterium LY-5]
MKKIRVGAVSYLNTKPLLYGIERSHNLPELELITGYPAKIAQQLIDDELDMGLVPVAIIPKLSQYFIKSKFCIGAVGEVATVCIFSEVPLEEVTEVMLDYQSRTSVKLAQVLLKKYWKLTPAFVPATEDFQTKIKGTTAAVVIGDRAFEQAKQSKYVYDLADAWVAYTGLPFVFAAWISNKPLPDEFWQRFDAANAQGFKHLNEIVAANDSPFYDLKTYYTENINYLLDDFKRKGLERFLVEIEELEKSPANL